MKKTIILMLLTSLIIIIIILISKNLFSSYDITGEVIEIDSLDNTLSLFVKKNIFTKQSRYRITIDENTEIELNGKSYTINGLIEDIQPGYKIKANIGNSTLFSDPPIVRATIIKLKGKL